MGTKTGSTKGNGIELRSEDAPQYRPGQPSEHPTDAILGTLREAHATLDLLLTLATQGDGPSAAQRIEALCDGTLQNALHGSMRRIEEAMDVVEGLPIGGS